MLLPYTAQKFLRLKQHVLVNKQYIHPLATWQTRLYLTLLSCVPNPHSSFSFSIQIRFAALSFNAFPDLMKSVQIIPTPLTKTTLLKFAAVSLVLLM